jgi:hypothetical protein
MMHALTTLSTSSDAGTAWLHSGQAEYIMELTIGTPPVPFIALANTGSVQVRLASPTLGMESWRRSRFSSGLWPEYVRHLCRQHRVRLRHLINGSTSLNSTGTVGLGRGSLSLVAKFGVNKFSYWKKIRCAQGANAFLCAHTLDARHVAQNKSCGRHKERLHDGLAPNPSVRKARPIQLQR